MVLILFIFLKYKENKILHGLAQYTYSYSVLNKEDLEQVRSIRKVSFYPKQKLCVLCFQVLPDSLLKNFLTIIWNWRETV